MRISPWESEKRFWFLGHNSVAVFGFEKGREEFAINGTGMNETS